MSLSVHGHRNKNLTAHTQTRAQVATDGLSGDSPQGMRLHALDFSTIGSTTFLRSLGSFGTFVSLSNTKHHFSLRRPVPSPLREPLLGRPVDTAELVERSERYL